MSKLNFIGMLSRSGRLLTKHAPEFLTGMGIAGMLSTTIMAVKATPKAVQLIEERKAELKTEKLPVGEIVKTTWKCYAPAAFTCAASMSCLIGSTSVSVRRNAAIAAACKLSETALGDYKDAVVETIGADKAREINDKAVEKAVERHPAKSSEIMVTKAGDTLCYDVFSARYFKSDPERIKAAINELNARMIDESYVSLSDYYDELNLSHTSISDSIGWDIDRGLLRYEPTPTYSEDDQLCLAISLGVAPQYDFDRFA